jgi:2',3'-cyclic-nucleotide 2'-phosphodiesterase (5'-nucleotidase family)
MGFQASAVGNHDLDGGTEAFAGVIAEELSDTGAYYPGARFPYLSSNLDFTTDENLAGLVVQDGQYAETIPNSLASSTVIDVKGEQIGIVGASTPQLASITSTGDITIYPEDGEDIAALATEIQGVVNELTASGINKIILLSHMQQISVEIELATLLEDVDIIVAGGSNTLLADNDDILREGETAATACVSEEYTSLYGASCTYPIALESLSGEPVLIVNTDGDYKYLGRLVLGFDNSGTIVEESLDSFVNGAYATDAMGMSLASYPEPNADVVDIADALSSVLIERDGNILGSTTVYLDGRRSQVRTQETNLGNLSADANLWLARQVDPDVDISIKNGGGIRDDIGYFAYPPGSVSVEDLQYYPPAANPTALKEGGEISQFDIQGALRFNNGLTLLTVTAQELVEIIEHAVSATELGATPGQFPQVSGIRFSFDPTADPNSRVVNLVVDGSGVDDVVLQNGVLQGDSTRTFGLVTLGFLAGGGDGYPFPATDRLDLVGSGYVGDDIGIISVEGANANFADAGSEQDAMAEYLQEYYDPTVDSASTPYDLEELPASLDDRIQNLSEREDTVL